MWKRAAVVVAFGVGGGCAAAPARARESSAGDGTGVLVTVRNRSRFDVHGLALRSSGRRPWGVERVGPGPLRAGQDRAFRLEGCAPRDVLLLDAHGAGCVLPGVGVCSENDGFTLTTDDLLRCVEWR